MISKIFRSVFLSTVIVLLISIASSLVISSYLMVKTDSEAMTEFANKLAAKINDNQEIDLSLLGIDTYRINLISSSGHVFYDSKIDVNKENLENHSDREEFRQALKYGRSKIYRMSETLDKRTVYYAVRLDNGNVLRCSYTADNIFSQTISLFLHLLIIVVLSIGISIILAKRLSAKIVEPINCIDLTKPQMDDVYPELRPFLDRITEHQHRIKKLLRKVTAAHLQMKVMTSNMSEGIIFLNKKGEIITLNQGALSLFKLEDEKELIGKPLFQIDRSALLCDIYEKKEALDNFNKEVEINGKFFNLIFSKITNKEKIIGYVLLFIDITKDKQLQKQRQEFASNVSHELKTPLQSIIGRAELIENGIVRPDDLKNFGLKIRTEGQALLNMINDIMFLSKVESGVKAQKEQINIKTLVDSVADSLKDKAQKKQVSIQVNCKEASFLFVRRYMSEILYNLIDNGIKYNKEGGKVECNISTNNQNLYISIKDNGIGIPSEDLGRIFERFFCVDRSHSNKDSTGLGLTIVKHIIEECNGHINVDSKLNVGTTFSITLPIEQ